MLLARRAAAAAAARLQRPASRAMSGSGLAAAESEPLLRSAIELGPRDGSHRGTIVFMHGLGDVAQSFAELFADHFSDLDGVRVVCLQAPTRPITVNGGMECPGWYDIVSLDRRGVDASGDAASTEDADGIARSRARIHDLLEEEAAAGVPVVVGGFSQGGAMAINAGLSFPRPLAGVVSLSGYVLERPSLDERRHEANRGTPVLAYHGEADDVVPVGFALSGYVQLREAGQPLEYNDEPRLGHSLSLAELHRMQHFFREHLGMFEAQPEAPQAPADGTARQ